jgi:hypothetical protein
MARNLYRIMDAAHERRINKKSYGPRRHRTALDGSIRRAVRNNCHRQGSQRNRRGGAKQAGEAFRLQNVADDVDG